MEGHMGFFHLLAIINRAAMNMNVQMSLEVPAFSSLGYILRRRISRSCDNFIFNFWWTAVLFFITAAPF